MANSIPSLPIKKQRVKKVLFITVIEGTKAKNIINILCKIPLKQRNKVKEITLDMAANMQLIAKKVFLMPLW